VKIIFLCPSVQKITGGIKCIFRMAATLRSFGYDAVVYEETGLRPKWFATEVPVVGAEVFRPAREQILVFPEDQHDVLEAFSNRPQRKVVYCQNHFYAARCMPDSRTYADFGVSHILCSGRTIHDYCRHRHPSLPAYVIPVGVDPQRFYPRPKQERIAFLPRKRPVEAKYIQDLFRFDYPQFRDIEWLPLENKSEPEIAEALGASSVFLVLHRLDSLPLTGLEAMPPVAWWPALRELEGGNTRGRKMVFGWMKTIFPPVFAGWPRPSGSRAIPVRGARLMPRPARKWRASIPRRPLRTRCAPRGRRS
jgi:hypothetical protein